LVVLHVFVETKHFSLRTRYFASAFSCFYALTSMAINHRYNNEYEAWNEGCMPHNSVLYGALLSLLLCVVLHISLAAQPPRETLTLTPSLLQSGINTQGKWLFIGEDSAEFASATYNDAAWKVLHDQTVLGDISPQWKGCGWFRLHITCDSAIGDETLALMLNHRSAAEIYIDGKRVAAQGLVGCSPYDEIEASALALIIPLQDNRRSETHSSESLTTKSGSIEVRKPRNHVIAVRFSNHNFLNLRSTWFFPNIVERFDSGFDIKIRSYNDALALVLRTRTVRTIVTMIPLGILLFVAFLYAVFYIFIRRDRTNLFLSLYSIATAILCFLLLYRIQGQANRFVMAWVGFFVVVSIAALAISLMAMLNWVVYRRLLPRLWLLWTPLLTILVAARFLLSSTVWNNLLIVLILGGLIDMTIIMLDALRQKVEDAMIIACGSAVFLISAGVYTFLYVQQQQHILWLYAMATYCSFLSMPVTMAFFIARRFARVNDRLLEQLDTVKQLSEQALEQEKEKQSLIEGQKQELERVVDERTKQLQESNTLLNEQTRQIQASNLELLRKNVEIASEREKADEILLNILPAPIAERLKAGEQTIAEKLHDVTVLFADIAGFTRFASSVAPEKLVAILDKVFSEFDRLVEKHNAEKIKTIGDAYMVVGGLWQHGSNVSVNHVEAIARLAIEMQDAVGRLSQELELIGLTVRIGLHSGEAVAGIIGTKKLNYDLWGDTVNTASRMESHGEAGKIHCTEQVAVRLRHKFIFTERGEIRIKGKGLMHTYFLEKEFDAASDELLKRAQMLALAGKE
jgi:class 3 adenylate cyclase